MSASKTSIGRSDVVLGHRGSSLLYRSQSVLAIVVLILSVVVIPVCGQLEHPTCGKRQLNAVLPEENGLASSPGRWPWYAAIYVPILNNLTIGCGGSIIGRNVILTAAHCLFSNELRLKEEDVSVHVGQMDLKTNLTAVQVFAVSKLIIHPEFNPRNVDHDIAIVKLSSDITMTQFVQPICIWSMADDESKIMGKNGTVVGFGRNERDELSEFLQEATLTVVDGNTCLMSDRETYGAVLTQNVFCAGGNQGIGATCNGDSGGGMFFEMGETWYVRGIISFIPKRRNDSTLCDSSKYMVFTDVSKYRDWLSQSIDPPKRLQQDFDPFLLVCVGDIFSPTNHIIRVPLNGGQSLRVYEGRQGYGIDHDCVEGRFYWSNFFGAQILSAKYDGTDRKPFITEDIGWPNGVAVDWLSRRLYWADEIKSTIEVASLDNPDVRTAIVPTTAGIPTHIAVDPFRGKLYWTLDLSEDWKIEWSNLDGTERQLLIESKQNKTPYGIQVSNATGELCYADNFNRIECIDPVSKQIRTITSNLTKAVGLALTDELFYWNNQRDKRIESINMDGVRQKHITSPLFDDKLWQMTLVTDNCPRFYSPCATNNGECPENTICLVNSSAPSGKICKLVSKGNSEEEE